MVVFGPRLREATVLSGKLSGSRTLAGQLRRALFVACVLTVLCSLAPAVANAAKVTLAWDANTDPDLAGYKLYYGLSSGSYQSSVDVGNVTSYTLPGLLDGRIYYFAATAYNVSQNESGFSNEVSKAIAAVTPPTVSISAPANGATVSGTAVTVSASASDNVGVAGVQFSLDGVNLGAEDTVAPYPASWNTTLATSGTHSLTAVARDAAGNTAPSAAVSVTVDNPPPLISTVSASSISSSGATITWVTNEASDSQVDYGPTTAYGSSTPLNASLLTAHAMTLTGLLATTTYHYRVKSRDAAGNLATSADFTLTTLIDTAPPTVSITSPLNGTTVSSTITVSATATDNVGVVGVQFKLDGANLGAEVLSAPYSISWNTQGRGDLIFGAAMADSGPIGIISAGSGFTKRQTLNGEDTVSEDKIQAASGSAAATFTFSAAARYMAHMAAFKASGTSAYVQGAGSFSNAAGNTIAQFFASNNAAGNLIVLVVSWGSNDAVSTTDSQGNVYSVATTIYDPLQNQSLAILYAANVKAGANTVTATFGSGTPVYRRLAVHEYSGIAAANPLDVTAMNTANGVTTPDAVTSGSATTTGTSPVSNGSHALTAQARDAAGNTAAAAAV